MPNISLYSTEGKEVGQIDLNSNIFDVEVNSHAMYLAVKRQLANARSGCACTKTRAEVRGGGKKPWRQKGTGRARHGSRRSPIWKGGGVTFGPKPRDYYMSLPKKVRRLALRSALTTKVKEGKCIIVEEISVSQPKTKLMVEFLKNHNLTGKTLIVVDKRDGNLEKSTRNIEKTKLILASNLNIHDVLSYTNIVLTKKSVEAIEEVLL